MAALKFAVFTTFIIVAVVVCENNASQSTHRVARGLPAYFFDSPVTSTTTTQQPPTTPPKPNGNLQADVNTTTTTVDPTIDNSNAAIRAAGDGTISSTTSIVVGSAAERRLPSSKATVMLEADEGTRPQCARVHDLPYCVEDTWYPNSEVNDAVGREFALGNSILLPPGTSALEAKFSSKSKSTISADDLIDGLSATDEDKLDYPFYYGKYVFKADFTAAAAATDSDSSTSSFEPKYAYYRYRNDYYKQGGYICPSNIAYKVIFRALNTQGQWRLVVNTDQDDTTTSNAAGLRQPLRLETCLYPMARCSYVSEFYHTANLIVELFDKVYQFVNISQFFPTNADSKCIQKFAYQRLVVYDTTRKRLGTDMFRLPTSCSCFIDGMSKIVMPKDLTVNDTEVSFISQASGVDSSSDGSARRRALLRQRLLASTGKSSSLRRNAIQRARPLPTRLSSSSSSSSTPIDDSDVIQTKQRDAVNYSDFYVNSGDRGSYADDVIPTKNLRTNSERPSTSGPPKKPKFNSDSSNTPPALGTFLAQLREHPLETLNAAASEQKPQTVPAPDNSGSVNEGNNNKDDQSGRLDAAASSTFSERIVEPDSYAEPPPPSHDDTWTTSRRSDERIINPSPSTSTEIDVSIRDRPPAEQNSRLKAKPTGLLAALDYPNFDTNVPEKPFANTGDDDDANGDNSGQASKDNGVSSYYDFNEHRHKMLVNPEKLDKAIEREASEALQHGDLQSALALDSTSANAPPLISQNSPMAVPPNGDYAERALSRGMPASSQPQQPTSSSTSRAGNDNLALQMLSMPSLGSIAYQPLSAFGRLSKEIASSPDTATPFLSKSTSAWLMRGSRKDSDQQQQHDPLQEQVKFQKLYVSTGKQSPAANSRSRRSLTLLITNNTSTAEPSNVTTTNGIASFVTTTKTTIIDRKQELDNILHRDYSSPRLTIKSSKRRPSVLSKWYSGNSTTIFMLADRLPIRQHHDSGDIADFNQMPNSLLNSSKYEKLAQLIEWQ